MLISKSFPIAKTSHECMACPWLFNNLIDYWCDLTFSEKRALVVARRQKEMILPGQMYVRQEVNKDGDKYTFTAIPEIHRICIRLDLYHND